MSKIVLDASAVLALLLREPGDDRVEAVRRNARLSAANGCEVLTRLIDLGIAPARAGGLLSDLGLDMIDVSQRDAAAAAALRGETRQAGLSLGDRLCLALAARDGATVLTADRAWAKIDVGLQIEQIR